MRSPLSILRNDRLDRALAAVEDDTGQPVEAEIVNGNGNGHAEYADVSTALATRGADGLSSSAYGRDTEGSWWNDLIAGGHDTNPELMGRAKYQVWREMKESDPAIRSLLFMFKLPILSAEWKLEPAEDDPGGPAMAEARADFARWQFNLNDKDGRLDLTWQQTLEQGPLLKLDYGAHGGELIWALPQRGQPLETWRDADGDEHPCIPLSRVLPIHAATVAEIDDDTMTGQITRLRQDVPGADWIPGSKLAWFVNEKEGRNWYGRAILRSVYGDWKLKRGLKIASAIGWDRWALGIPVIWYPEGKKKEAEAMARNVRSHERGYMVFRGPRPTATDAGGEWDFEVVSGSGSLMDPVPLLRQYDQQIAVAGLQHFSTLGQSGTSHGSYALAKAAQGPYYMALQAIATDIAAVWRKQVLAPLWRINFGPDVPLPKLTVAKIEPDDLTVLAQALADLHTAGLEFTDRDAVDNIRDRIPLPRLPEQVRNAITGLPEDVGVRPSVAVPVEGGLIAPPAQG